MRNPLDKSSVCAELGRSTSEGESAYPRRNCYRGSYVAGNWKRARWQEPSVTRACAKNSSRRGTRLERPAALLLKLAQIARSLRQQPVAKGHDLRQTRGRLRADDPVG